MINFYFMVGIDWNYCFVIWEMVIDQFGGEGDIVVFDVDVVVVDFQFDFVIIVFQQVLKFGYVFVWYDDLVFGIVWFGQFGFIQCQMVVVGGDGMQGIIVQIEQQVIEVIVYVLLGYCECGVFDQFFQGCFVDGYVFSGFYFVN